MARMNRASSTQRGFSLIELMVALVLSLFVLGALYSIFDSNARTYQDNEKLTQLADSQRFALTVLAEVTELAGYFPDPTTQTASTEFPSDALFPADGAYVGGTTGAAGSTGDTLAVRFVTAPNDGLLNCSGVDNSGSSDTLYENVFSVNAQDELVCALNGATPEVLVNGVQSMSVEYGVQGPGYETYKSASQMSVEDWLNVLSVKVTLAFINPLANETGEPPTIPVTRVIALMAQLGGDGPPLQNASGPVGSDAGNGNNQNNRGNGRFQGNWGKGN